MDKRPKIGIGVLIMHQGKALIGKRKNAHGHGTWALPGGHLEYKELWETCAKREVMEETGITITNLRFITATNDIFDKEDKHYVTIFILADYASGTVEVKEPHKCEKWEWFAPDHLPAPLFIPLQNFVKTKAYSSLIV